MKLDYALTAIAKQREKGAGKELTRAAIRLLHAMEVDERGLVRLRGLIEAAEHLDPENATLTTAQIRNAIDKEER